METNELMEKSITEQILNELLLRIEKRGEFDEIVVQKLKELVSSGNFSKVKRIAEVIKIIPEVKS